MREDGARAAMANDEGGQLARDQFMRERNPSETSTLRCEKKRKRGSECRKRAKHTNIGHPKETQESKTENSNKTRGETSGGIDLAETKLLKPKIGRAHV